MCGKRAKAPPLDPAVLDLYKIAIEMADRISARRGAANSFYVSLQSAIVTAVGFLLTNNSTNRKILAGVALAGAVTSVTWFLLLRSYRDLNKAKFKVILEMERQLPYGIYGAEWDYLKKDPIKRWRFRYAEFGTIERLVPFIFFVLNAVLGVYLWCS
ncbi:RipA family octameric membrane protein [Promicromonospora sukumoe]